MATEDIENAGGSHPVSSALDFPLSRLDSKVKMRIDEAREITIDSYKETLSDIDLFDGEEEWLELDEDSLSLEMLDEWEGNPFEGMDDEELTAHAETIQKQLKKAKLGNADLEAIKEAMKKDGMNVNGEAWKKVFSRMKNIEKAKMVALSAMRGVAKGTKTIAELATGEEADVFVAGAKKLKNKAKEEVKRTALAAGKKTVQVSASLVKKLVVKLVSMMAGAVLTPLVLVLVALLVITSIFTITCATAVRSTATGAEKIIEVAREELSVASDNVGGYKYKDWYGMDADWCAMFLSWCANECGYIDSGTMPKQSSVAIMKEWYEEAGLYRENDGSTLPTPGDVVFFCNDASHVGLVVEVDEDSGRFTTIEGNSGVSTETGMGATYHKGSRVTSPSYYLSQSTLSGFATPNYPNLLGDTTEEQVFNWLVAQGFSKESACGIMGNIAQESDFDPSAIQNNGAGPAAGLFQWENYSTASGRWKAMSDYCESKGRSWTDLECQLEYMLSELSGGDSTTTSLLAAYGGVDGLKAMTDVEDACYCFEKCFERAGSPNMESRYSSAHAYYNIYVVTMGY